MAIAQAVDTWHLDGTASEEVASEDGRADVEHDAGGDEESEGVGGEAARGEGTVGGAGGSQGGRGQWTGRRSEERGQRTMPARSLRYRDVCEVPLGEVLLAARINQQKTMSNVRAKHMLHMQDLARLTSTLSLDRDSTEPAGLGQHQWD